MARDNAGASAGPPPIASLAEARTDYEDVPVPQLGGMVIRLYALSGQDRGAIFSEMAALVRDRSESDIREADPDTIRKVLDFQTHVVAASMGYPQSAWPALGGAISADTIEDVLFPVCERLSKLGATEKVKADLKATPSVVSGSG
jgi:hypothetical protein